MVVLGYFVEFIVIRVIFVETISVFRFIISHSFIVRSCFSVQLVTFDSV